MSLSNIFLVPGFGGLGPNIILNGDFAAGTANWTLGAGWSVSGGEAVATSVAAFVTIGQASVPFVAGAVYRVTFEVTSYTSGGVRLAFVGGTTFTGTSRTATGIYTQDVTALAGNNDFRMQANASGFTGAIDNITVRRVY